MSVVIAIDPGDTHSAFVLYNTETGQFEKPGWKGASFGKVPNDEMRNLVRTRGDYGDRTMHLAVEMIASYGMPVGREVFETCLWIGRFVEAWNRPSQSTLVYRRDVKLHLCGSARAKDGNVRTALLDRYGGKTAAVGNKKSSGPLYGVSADVWSALAVAVTYSDTQSANARKSQPVAFCEVSP